MFFSNDGKLFYDPDASKEAIAGAGEKLMINLFKKGFKGSLSELRAKVFMTKVKSRSMVKPSSLPPTSDETAQHSYRVSSSSGLARKRFKPVGMGLVFAAKSTLSTNEYSTSCSRFSSELYPMQL